MAGVFLYLQNWGGGLSKMRIPNLHWCKLLFSSDSLIVSDAFGNEWLGLSESLTGPQAREAYQRGPDERSEETP